MDSMSPREPSGVEPGARGSMRASIKAKNRRYQTYYGSPIEMVGTPSSTIIFPEDPDADSTPEEALVPWKSLASAAPPPPPPPTPPCAPPSPPPPPPPH